MNHPAFLWLRTLTVSISSMSLLAFGMLLPHHLYSADIQSTPAKAEAASPSTIVIGFVGGFVHHDDTVHQEVQLAAHLQRDYPSDSQIKIFANHSGRLAHQEILRMLDADHNGTLSGGEKRRARIVLYGHSWGASEAVNIARALERDGVPVLLTVQVDSVPKLGVNDRFIPANVAQAVNFYQTNGFLHGRRKIFATDPKRTEILGNFQFDYGAHTIQCDGYPWYAQIFMKPHIEIESDPIVWKRVESLIRSKLSPAAPSPEAATSLQ